MKKIKNTKLVTWLGIFIIFVCVCHSLATYHFYYMEQWNTFYWDGDAICQTLSQSGGISLLLADFLMQFFCYGAGPFIFGFLMTLVAYAQSLWARTGPQYLGCVTAVMMLVTLTSNMANLLSGSVCFVIVMFLMSVVLRSRKWLKIVAVALLALLVRKNCLVRDGTELNLMFFLPWITAGGVFLLQIFLRNVQRYVGKYDLLAQLIMVVGMSVILIVSNYDAKEEYMKKIAYYVRYHQWDEIINRSSSRGSKGNTVFQICRNMALAEKGELGEKFLMYEQKGIESFFSQNVVTLQDAMILMDVYYTMGYVNLSQVSAFEAQESVDDKSPYLWQRLVDTNIENGAYAVAEKYIKKLETTLAYRHWAHERRRFLYNDTAVLLDPVLGKKRKCIFKDDIFIGSCGIGSDLERIVAACPEHRASLDYLGVMYVFANQRGKFINLMNKYKGTKVMPRIPASFEKVMKTYELQTAGPLL